jgi:leucyl-tRNA synthetase
MKAQLKSMGLSLDWAREIATCDPSYYKHQQKMFLDFLQAGLVERKLGKVNWDPVDRTVLANEQVIDGADGARAHWSSSGRCRSGTSPSPSFPRTCCTAIDGLDRWPEKVRVMQRNWIGRSEGLHIRFALDPATTPNRRRPSSRSSPRATTRCSAPSSWRCRPIIRLRRAAADESRARRIHRGMPAPRHRPAADRHRGEARLRHRE